MIEPIADEYAWTPAWKLRDLLVKRELSAVELTTMCLERIERVEPSIHAFISLMADRALTDARAADAAIMDGKTGPLHGIPVTLKDDIWVTGARATAGSLLLEAFLPPEDSVVAERLRRAGAIIVGKTNLPEFAGFTRTMNHVAPECRNPWDTTRTTGGSSGGSAASLAAGMVPIAVGTDGGGSTRLPAALNGVIGLYATKGLIPNYGSFTYGQCDMGPMGRDVRDVAELLQVMAGPDERDPWCRQLSVPDYLSHLNAGVRGMRMAWSSDFGHIIPLDRSVVSAVRDAAATFERLGATIEEHADAGVGDVAAAYYTVKPRHFEHGEGPLQYRSSAEYRKLVEEPEKLALLCPYEREPSSSGVKLSYEEAAATRRRARGQFADLFARYDVLLTPTISAVAPPITNDWSNPFPDIYHQYICYTVAANFCGLPAISVPAGTINGLPIGIQILARPFDESTLLRVSRALEMAAPWTHASI